MKKKKRKIKVGRILFLILTILLATCAYVIHRNTLYDKVSNNSILDIVTSKDTSKYKIIKQDKNENYSGIGQEKIENKDGYFTTFTTIENNQKTYNEYKQNGIASWSDNAYWGGNMAENGCGITVMSIILSGYNKDFTPEDLRQKYYPHLDYETLSSVLSKDYNIKNSGFYYDSVHLSSKNITEHLKSNRPIIICVWNKPSENRWTTTSHYMALLATDDNGMVYVSNPNRR